MESGEKSPKKHIVMARTLRVTVISVALILLLQLINSSYFIYINSIEVRELRDTRLKQASQALEEDILEGTLLLERLHSDSIVSEFSYRSEIGSRNLEKIKNLLRTIESMSVSIDHRYELYVYLRNADVCYGRRGAVELGGDSGSFLQMRGVSLPVESGEGSRAILLTGIDVNSSSGGRLTANVLVYENDLACAMAVFPQSHHDRVLENALVESGTVGIVFDREGNRLAGSEELAFRHIDDAEMFTQQLNSGELGRKYIFEWRQDERFGAVVGFELGAPLGSTERIRLHVALTFVGSFAIIAVFLFVFLREIYSPVKGIVSKLDIGRIDRLGNEFSVIDVTVNSMNARLNTLATYLEAHDELFLENTLNKLAMGVQVPDQDMERPEVPKHFIVLTAVHEDDGGRESDEVIERITDILEENYKARRFYHVNKQWSFFVELAAGSSDDFSALTEDPALERLTFIGISRIHTELSELRKALEESWDVFLRPVGGPTRKCVVYRSGSGVVPAGLTPNLNMQEETALINGMLRGDAETVRGCLRSIFAGNAESSVLQQRELHSYLYNLMMAQLKNSNADPAKDGLDTAGAIRGGYNPAYLNRILEERFLEATGEFSFEGDLMQTILDFLDANYNKPVYLQKVADEVGLSYSYVSRYFKQKAGIGFSDFLTKMRIEKAKQLLVETNFTVQTVAAETGFDLINTFNRSFKKHTGMTPGEYRRLYTKLGPAENEIEI